MNRRFLRDVKRIVLRTCGDELVSLYVIGSFVSTDITKSSDIDLIGVMKTDFDFRKEPLINRTLNKEVHSSHNIDLGTMNYDEFFGGPRKGSLMKHIELAVFLNFLKRSRLIYGKRIDFDNLPTKPAPPKEELAYHIKVFNEFKSAFRKKNKIRADFTFADFIKIVFYIANLELQLKRNMKPRLAYSAIVKAFKIDESHIIHFSMKLRRKETISRRERELWLNLAERYVARMSHDFEISTP